MLKSTLIIAACALAAAVFVSTVAGPLAMAANPKCKNKVNKYVACAEKFKTNAQRKAGGVGDKDVQTLGAISTAIKRGTMKRVPPVRAGH